MSDISDFFFIYQKLFGNLEFQKQIATDTFSVKAICKLLITIENTIITT